MVICRLGLNGSSPIFSEQVKLCSSTSYISSTISSMMSKRQHVTPPVQHCPQNLSQSNYSIEDRAGQHSNHLGPGQHHKHYLSPGQLSCQNIMNFMLQDNISNMIYIQDNKVVKPHAPGQHLKPDDLYPGQPGSVRRHVAPRAHLLLPAGQCHQHPPLPK